MFKSIQLAAKPRKGAVVVVGVFAEEMKLPADLAGVEPSTRKALEIGLKAPGFKADAGDTHLTHTGDLLLGLGKRSELTPDALRVIGAKLAIRLDNMAAKAANVYVAEALGATSIPARVAGRAVGEGMGLGNWRVDFFAGTASNTKPANPPLTVAAADVEFRNGLERGLLLAESTNYARRIGVTPPNICNPAWIANEARKLARATGMTCKVISFNQARQLGMGGIVNVGMGSENKPCLVILEYRPTRIAPAARGQRLALVGKTMTYDTGGYSLKISGSMKGMKYDKCGGIAVLGALHAIAALKLPVHVIGVLACAENMISGDAYRPDDIITMYNGVSVEVTNTDAEGRLVLGDALAYACKDLKATAIVDLATLTGGIVTALGHFCSGVFCNDDDLLTRLNQASETSGEKIWRMPLWKEHKDFMRSPHADILNSNPSRNAHPIQGAAFLAYFVDEKIPWAHIDIAGVGNTDKDSDLYVQGATGYGVRMLVDLVEGYSK